jgi:hypothetical protein
MNSENAVERADRISRGRALLFSAATIIFLASQALSRPFFGEGVESASRARVDWWAVNVAVLLACLATGASGLLNPRHIRALVNDEVTRGHLRTSIAVAYWLGTGIAMAFYLLPGLRDRSAQEAVYAIVTPSLAAALLVFSFLELRAHRDA